MARENVRINTTRTKSIHLAVLLRGNEDNAEDTDYNIDLIIPSS